VHVVREFLSALGDGRTYRNPYTLFGLLWGLPIPVFSVAVQLWASGQAFTAGLLAHPVQLLFLLHPPLFAVVFGAMGTIRHRKDARIASLLEETERHLKELAAANERLKELDQLKAQFMANVTHELKTPLVSIRGYNEAILEGRFGPLTEKQRDGLATACRNIDRLQSLIEELLEFERIDSGALRLEIAPFDLVAVVQGALRTLQPQVDRKRLAVEAVMPAEVVVRGDRDRIGRVMLNLLSNAVKFTPDGGAMGVTVTEDGAVTVWDRGPGIPSAAQQHLFTRFWQADGTSRRKHGGTGLGLAICKGILDAHGAAIEVVSAEGAGTSASFRLPPAKEPARAS
jgi:signal transduction histidine kinase